ncbi:hypothetical protein SEA_MICRODON_50 [Streptomyces phage Microdon]|nr:hypothetical protein SEA_MICRODON_50 [Streptomyces phage Microdon]
MPRLNAVRRPLEVAEAPAPAAPAAPAPRPSRPHEAADHISFRNADGTVSRICICVCDTCWPPTAGKHPGPCPDWNDEDV